MSTRISEKESMTRRRFIRGAAFMAGVLALSLGGVSRAAEQTAALASAAGKSVLDYMKDRIACVYEREKKMPKRRSQDNPEIIRIYADFLGSPMSAKAEKFLHRELTDRSAQLAKLRKKGIYPYSRAAKFPASYPFESGN